MKKSELRKLIVDGEITLSDVIDIVIEENGIIGVGLITLADSIKFHIRQHSQKSK